MKKHGQPGMFRTKQEITANQCPMRCGEPSVVLLARPPAGSVATWWSRCQRCLCFWETSPAGKVTALKGVPSMQLCPECLDVKFPDKPHVCASK